MTVRWADPQDPSDIDELVRLRQVMFDGMGLSFRDGGWRGVVAEQLRTGLADGRFLAAVVDAPAGAGLAACGIGMIRVGLPWPGDTVGQRGYVQSMATDPAARGTTRTDPAWPTAMRWTRWPASRPGWSCRPGAGHPICARSSCSPRALWCAH